jgi:hypothetical protein
MVIVRIDRLSLDETASATRSGSRPARCAASAAIELDGASN